jgi:hypothetical protein
MKSHWLSGCFYLLLTLCWSSLTYAALQNPIEVTTYIGNKPPLGSGTVTGLFTQLYEVTIWTQAERWSWDSPFVLRLKYAKAFSHDQIVDASISEIDKIHNLDDATKQYYRQTLETIFPSVQKDDAISAVYLPGEKLLFFYNGHQIATITNMRLARDFLDIWLSDHTREPELRNSILKFSGEYRNYND